MARNLSTNFRAELEGPDSVVYPVVLIEISHPSLPAPVRLANDLVGYVWQGNQYVGWPFILQLLSDDERPPRGQLTLQNVDRVIGETIRGFSSAPGLSIYLLASDQFDDPVDGYRAEIGSPAAEYSATHLRLRNIRVDPLAVQCEIASYDLSTEPWPMIRSTPDRLPGLDP